ncbi:hypothetical protein [Paenibacillus pseudetheri]|uniref:Uncharacterized protein n=1 Tax=Paenibacillus pseudetheri TaxID=2897682 RepID=A0ABN8FTM4_9BACL|nr:hypothetical protein [Paenibacillus pseudetheri]CAH1059797.1 hypothetical protein PAECIP111894_06009 [Paenibacillus pseudetheri]
MNLKRMVVGIAVLSILICSLALTPFGRNLRIDTAEKLISTRLQDETWILVGKDKRDELIKEFEEKYGIP